jgi:hypothetical protein
VYEAHFLRIRTDKRILAFVETLVVLEPEDRGIGSPRTEKMRVLAFSDHLENSTYVRIRRSFMKLDVIG